MLSDYLVYVINLDRRPDRWIAVKTMLNRFSFYTVHRARAVDGKLLTPSQIANITTEESRESLHRPRKRHEELGSTGAIGCSLSHIEAWQQIAKSDRASLVVEDDALFSPSISQTRLFSSPDETLQGYDIVLLGYSVLREPIVAGNSNSIQPYDKMFFGTQFYYLTPRGARILLEQAFPIQVQIDAYIGQQSRQHRIRMGVHRPSLASQQYGLGTDIQTACHNCNASRDDESDTSSRMKWMSVFVAGLLVAVGLSFVFTKHTNRLPSLS